MRYAERNEAGKWQEAEGEPGGDCAVFVNTFKDFENDLREQGWDSLDQFLDRGNLRGVQIVGKWVSYHDGAYGMTVVVIEPADVLPLA